ncbi:MAG TPA: hypothetical protein VGR72_13985 [Candidatus Acidoferrales bacterium]|nr:hypothetical protein [Candidatus Acidoferrales bacterium]
MSPVRKRVRPARPRRGKRPRTKKPRRDSAAWIRSLAAPYLQDYKPVRVSDGLLNGFWFCAPALRSSPSSSSHKSGTPPTRGQSAGFFVGYFESAGEFAFLGLQPPECVVFAWVHPVGGKLHKHLVFTKGSLLRLTFEYIRWLTHRPPRFVFHDAKLPAMTRHQSMQDWPKEKRAHLSRNFFIETLAWLVRGGLVRKLREEAT